MNLSNLWGGKKLIFGIIGVVLLAELVWAGFTLLGERKVGSGTVESLPGGASGALSLNSSRSSLKVGETVIVSIDVSSQVATDGIDVILLYDPKLLSVVAGTNKLPVAFGTLYSDYPSNQVDEGIGRITLSGITSQAGGVVAKGTVGMVTFTAKAPGIAKVALDFTPGSTTDSNVIETRSAKDVLKSVKDLELNITQ